MAQKPSIPKGTRDFSPVEMRRRQYILDTIRGVFERYGYLPIETPAMEKLETLTGKYGEEGDRLIFKVLNSGDAWDKVAPEVKQALAAGEEVHPGKLGAELCEKALRYDLTVPFARFVVQHQHALTFPFKRYQMQPVWRADRPQKGRYREFLQCDADVIGSTSLLNEVELVQLFDDVFTALGLAVVVKLNDRKLLTGIAEVSGQPEKVVDIVTALDKLDKVGREAVEQEMRDKGVSEAAVTGIAPLFELHGNWDAQRTRLTEWLGGSEVAQQGLADMDFIFQQAGQLKSAQLEFDPTLARGLDYYTGAIFEVKAAEGTLQSSICGGGRYDDLTGIFGLQGMSGVGISFGADRIYDVLLETGKFPEDVATGTRLLFVNFGDREAAHALPLLRQVREAGIAAELYPDAAKLKKQFAYADAKGIPYVATMGSEEIAQGIVSVKDLRSGEQRAVRTDELISLVQ
ncbi:MAG: histidine--tRNA ligase [Flavobacteriales bacterium]|nr:histidine--tRNA ligase [Flavobacteriales bacterium]